MDILEKIITIKMLICTAIFEAINVIVSVQKRIYAATNQ